MKRYKQSPATIRQLLEQQNNKCNKCGKVLGDRSNYHVDHIIPIGKGGKDYYSNLQILCIDCHDIKTGQDGYGLKIKKRENMAICDICGKVVLGFSQDHANFLMAQHSLKHNKYKK